MSSWPFPTAKLQGVVSLSSLFDPDIMSREPWPRWPFELGDRVVEENPIYHGEFTRISGTIIGFTKGGDAPGAWIEMDEETKKRTMLIGGGQTWFVNLDHLRILDDEPEAKKGYVPDGFDPEAHRNFMRTLG